MIKRLLMAVMAIFLIAGTAAAQSTTRGVTTWTADQNYVTNIQNQLNALAAANALSISGTFPVVVSGPPHAVVSISGVTALQGNGTKLQLSTGGTVANDCVKFDANGNTVDNGSTCGGGGSPGTGLVNKVFNVTDSPYSALGNNSGNDAPAIQAAIAAACAAVASSLSVPKVYMPAGVYRTLAPIFDRCPGGPNIQVEGAGYHSTYINTAFEGPAFIVTGGATYPSFNNITVGTNIIPSGSGASLTFANSGVTGYFDLNEVLGLNTGALPAQGPWNGQAAWSIQMHIKPSDVATRRCLWSSDGALNSANFTGPQNSLTAPTGAMGFLCQGSDAKLYGALNIGGTMRALNSGATVLVNATEYEVEMNYDNVTGNLNLYLGSGTVNRVAQLTGLSGTITQRADESNILGGDAGAWPPMNGVQVPWGGSIQSVRFSSTARHTAASYAESTADYANDANTQFLMNQSLTSFPSNAAGIQVEQGILGSGPWWLAYHDAGTGCCSGDTRLSDFSIVGSATLGVFGNGALLDSERVVPTLGANSSYIGIEISPNAGFGSIVRDAPQYDPIQATLTGVMLLGGISTGRDLQLGNGSNYAGVLAAGTHYDNIFFQTNTRNVCGLALIGNGATRLEGVTFDSENGGGFAGFCVQHFANYEIEIANSDMDTVGASLGALANMYGGNGADRITFDHDDIKVPTTIGAMIDATFMHGGGGAQPAPTTAVANFSNNFYHVGGQSGDVPPSGVNYTNNGLQVSTLESQQQFPNLAVPVLPHFVSSAPTACFASPCAIAMPPNPQAGRVVVVALDVSGNTITAVPSGWALGCIFDDHVASFHHYRQYWHVIGINDPTTASWSFTGANNPNALAIQFAGLNQSNPVGQCFTSTTASNSNFTATGGTASDINALTLATIGNSSFSAATIAAPPTGFMASSTLTSSPVWNYLARSLTVPSLSASTSGTPNWSALQSTWLPDQTVTGVMPFNQGVSPTWFNEVAPQFKSVSNTAPQATITGTTAGSAVWSMPGVGPSVKAVAINLIGYQNSTGAAQTGTYANNGVAFTTTANVVTDGGSCAGVTTSLTGFTLPINMGGTQSGFCVVVGY